MKTVTQDEELKDAVKSGKTVVMVHATWCPFCRRFVQPFTRQTSQLKGWNALECVIDDEENPIWARYNIQVVPTVLFFEDGKVTRRLDSRLGMQLSEPELQKALTEAHAL